MGKVAHNNIEIEIQARVEKIKPLLKFLRKNGKFVAEKRQIDQYFSPKDKNKDYLKERPVIEWLRLRDAEGKYLITYKYWHHDKNGRSYYSDEYETEVGSINQVRKILEALGFRLISVVDKVRKVWNYEDYEITIDVVKTLGNFVEVEYIGKNEKTDQKKVGDEMIDFLKKLGCGKLELSWQGYPFQLLFPKEVKYEVV